MAAYDAERWSDLFIASAGAAAALAGLLFVAVSINVERIIALPSVPERALETVVGLLGALVTSLIVLVPQGRMALGTELLGWSLLLAAVVAALMARGAREPAARPWLRRRVAYALSGIVPAVIGGASVLAESGGGLYWTAAAVAGAFVAGVLNAWVLLIEILR